ncbi:MAG: GHKL domain-containing protein [Bacteroidetes bacterium]|nr:GHKL domain-containing protein [Bacteroidota bacterium]
MKTYHFPYRRVLSLATLGLILVATGYLLFAGRSTENIAEQSVRYLQHEVNRLEAEVLSEIDDSATLFKALEQSSEQEAFILRNADKAYRILVFKEGELKMWTNNEVVPQNINRIFRNKFNFIKLNNGFYEVIRIEYSEDIVALGIIPVYYIYPIVNKYLVEGFNFEDPVLEQVKISSSESGWEVNSLDGNELFQVEVNENVVVRCPAFLWWLQAIGIILFLAAGIRLSSNEIRRSRPGLGIVLVVMTLTVVIGLHYTNILLYTGHVQLFSSRIYASSSFVSSLGILLVLSLASLCLFIFANRFIKLPRVNHLGVMSDLYLLLLYLFNTVVFIATVLIIKSVVDNSTISFDFYNFYTLSVFSMAGMLVFAIWFVILYILFNKTAYVSKGFAEYKLFLVVLLCTAVVYLTIKGISHIDSNWIALFFLLIAAYFILTETGVLKFNFINYLLIVSLFSWTTAHIITSDIASKQFDKQKDFISELLFERDLSEEFQFMESGNNILDDNFIKRYFRSPFLNDYDLEERLKTKYFSKFEGRYNIYVYPYNLNNLPLKGELERDFEYLNDLYRKKSSNTVTSNIKYFSGASESLKYLIYYPVYEGSDALGHIFVEVVPKVFGSSSAYPELLISGDQSGQPAEDDYEYAIYGENTLRKSRGDYEYTASLNFDVGEIGEYIFYNDNDYNHLVFNNDGETVVVLSKKKRSIISPFSAFSYTFCLFLLIVLLLWALGLRRFILSRDQIPVDSQPVTLQRRIQISMISLVLSSLFIIGVVTLIYFQNQYNTYHNARLLRKANALVKSLNAYIKDAAPNNNTEVHFEEIMDERILTLAKIHSLDLNVYRTDGKLMITSQPDIFNKDLVSRNINSLALLNLRHKGKSRHVQDELVGRLNYLSAYLPYRNNAGETLAYLHFPYYSKQQSFRADISYFLVALVNVYVLLILTATAIALLLSRSITNSLTIIKDRLSTIKLREKNVPIEWKNKDEIGMLVAEYNRMIEELELSAELLAKSERETAWREMAKQVAHEIKNPLTPMKLSIQHLQRALKDDREDTKELTVQVTNRLIEQIDNLTHIASEFSSFASMPLANLQKIDLKEVVKSTSALFQHLQHVSVVTEVPDNPCWVEADKNQMIGVFNNLLKNASQAIFEEGDGIITVRLKEKDEVFRVEVEDNGVGISEEKKGKVFEPNFTTKSSGTGLGLAISKNIIEKSKGNIWFESEIGKGTIFYVVLPIYEMND